MDEPDRLIRSKKGAVVDAKQGSEKRVRYSGATCDRARAEVGLGLFQVALGPTAYMDLLAVSST
jgi:hypothetical protein